MRYFLRRSCYTAYYFLLLATAHAQYNSDEGYRKPLKDVLDEIQSKYDVQIKYADSLVRDKWVLYAEWKMRPDVETTLDNVLKPLEMKVRKEKDKVYRLSNYEYYRWAVEDGWAELDRIASQYHNVQEWEKRKRELKACLMDALELNPLPPAPPAKPTITPVRRFDGYTVQNIAIEILPGLYINGS